IGVKLRRARAEAVEYSHQPRLLVCLQGQVICLRLQRIEIDVARRFDHQLETTCVTKTAHRRGTKDEYSSVGHFAQALANLIEDDLIGQPMLPPLVERLQNDEH